MKQAGKLRQTGFGLVEILVALAIGLFLISGLVNVLVNINQGNQLVEDLNFQHDNARVAQDLISRSLLNSGHWGGLEANDIVAASGLNLTASGNCDQSWIIDTSEPVRGYDGAASMGATTFPTGCIDAANYQANTDVLVLRYADPEYPIPSADITATTGLVVRTVLADANLGNTGQIFEGSAGIPSLLATGDPMASYNYLYRADIYYIRGCSVMAPSCDGIPTLVRMRYGSSGYVTEPLVENVEQFQVEFGQDTNNDSVVDRYDEPASVTDWQDVISIRFDLVVRNEKTTSEFADGETYDLAGGFSYDVDSVDEKYRRKVYFKTVQVRNLSRI